MTSWSSELSCTFGFGEQMNQITGFLDGEINYKLCVTCHKSIVMIQAAVCMAQMKRMRRLSGITKADYSSKFVQQYFVILIII